MIKDFLQTLKLMLDGVGRLSKEGRKIVIFTLALAIVAIVFAITWHRSWVWLFDMGIVLFVFCMFFFRNPKRKNIFAPDEIASPADGRVISISIEKDPNIVVIRIFLSIFDVHIQRSPISAKVEDIIYTKGSFAFASNDDAKNNERNLIKLSSENRFAHIEQITGAVARRISCWVEKEQQIQTAQDIGLIYFGSQVALYLPKNKVRILVKKGQKVQGGLTVVGLWQN